MSLASLLKECREAKGWSFRQAAPHLHTSHVHLWQIEQGTHTNLTIKTLRRAQQCYGIPTSKLWAAACETLKGADNGN